MDLSRRTAFKDIFNRAIDEACSICILGHVNPDGDCLGSVLSVAAYIRNKSKAAAQEGKKVRVFLEEASAKFSFLPGFFEICHDPETQEGHDLCIVLDCGDLGRVGKFRSLFTSAKKSICVDHHITNEGFAGSELIEPEASSTSELVFDLFEREYVDADVARAVYTGIVHDTGVFRYSCTSAHTMRVAAECMGYGIDFGGIIDDSFFSMNGNQKLMLGKVLSDMELHLDGAVAVGYARLRDMEQFGISVKDMDGFIDELRTTRGAKAALFLYQCKNSTYKVSLRSNTDQVDVARIASEHSGGGHKRAAGCYMGPDLKADIKILVEAIEGQLKEEKQHE